MRHTSAAQQDTDVGANSCVPRCREAPEKIVCDKSCQTAFLALASAVRAGAYLSASSRTPLLPTARACIERYPPNRFRAMSSLGRSTRSRGFFCSIIFVCCGAAGVGTTRSVPGEGTARRWSTAPSQSARSSLRSGHERKVKLLPRLAPRRVQTAFCRMSGVLHSRLNRLHGGGDGQELLPIRRNSTNLRPDCLMASWYVCPRLAALIVQNTHRC